jgi:hypothetical protein
MMISEDTGPIARLVRLDPRQVWKQEARDFTPWLADNLDALSEALGIDLEIVEQEAPVGNFSADIVARDPNTGRLVLIENQLEPTDHSHLGQIITYAAGLGASVVIWVCRELRDEHRQGLDWLNQHTDDETDFFGVVVELLQIDGSRPAVNFRVVAQPNTWSQQAKAQVASADLSEKRASYQSFFQILIDELRTKHHFTNARVGQPQNWYSFPSGVSECRYSVVFSSNERMRVELYIDSQSGDLNKAVYDALLARRSEIEAAFGQSLSWERLDNRRASRIAVYRPDSSILGGSTDDLREWAIKSLLKMRDTFSSQLRGTIEEAATHLQAARALETDALTEGQLMADTPADSSTPG